MDEQRHALRRCSGKVTDKTVRFCVMCTRGLACKKCKLCDKMFDEKKPLRTTAFHQVKNVLMTTGVRDKARMIVDLGCPNSVIGVSDVEKFRKSLSHYQQENTELLSVDENFKFGPSGPYHCSKKMRIPIGRKGTAFWIDIAIVHADIPMLLGNNILKPLEAEIKLLDTGNGFLKLDEEKLELKETQAGHYTVDVSALGKLCYVPHDVKVNHGFECRLCDKVLNSRSSLNLHVDTEHGGSLQCDLCDDILKCNERLNLHMEAQHESISESEEKKPKQSALKM